MKRDVILRWMLFSVGLIVLAILSYHWFDNLTNIHFQGYIGSASQPVYIFSEKQIHSILATYKDLPTLEQITDSTTYGKLHERVPKSKTFFIQAPKGTAIVETKTEPLCGSFYLSFPKKNLPKDDNLVFVADKSGNLWYRLVRVPEDVRSPEVDLDSPKIIHNRVSGN